MTETQEQREAFAEFVEAGKQYFGLSLVRQSELYPLAANAIMEHERTERKEMTNYCYFTLGYCKRYTYDETKNLVHSLMIGDGYALNG